MPNTAFDDPEHLTRTLRRVLRHIQLQPQPVLTPCGQDLPVGTEHRPGDAGQGLTQWHAGHDCRWPACGRP